MIPEMEKELTELKLDFATKCIAFRDKWFDDPSGFQIFRVPSNALDDPTKLGFAIDYDKIKRQQTT